MEAKLYLELRDLTLCECCGTDTTARLFVKLPEHLKNCRLNGVKFRLKNKAEAWLCLDCVKSHCFTTLRIFWKKILYPSLAL